MQSIAEVNLAGTGVATVILPGLVMHFVHGVATAMQTHGRTSDNGRRRGVAHLAVGHLSVGGVSMHNRYMVGFTEGVYASSILYYATNIVNCCSFLGLVVLRYVVCESALSMF